MRNKTRPILILFLLLWCAALVVPLGAQDDAASPAASPPPAAAVEKSLVDLFLAGGALMWPILLCSVGTIAVGVYCFLQINQKKMMPKAQEAAVSQFMQHQDPNGAYQLCQSSPNVFANSMSAALLKVNFERDLANKASMEQAAGETLMQEEQRLMIWVNYLNIFATIAPMLGLLGTVTGMIASFDQLAAGRSEPSDLAGGIGEAMLTTAGGLIVGIPAMFLFFYFRNLLQVAVGNIQKSVTFMIDVLSGELKLEAGLHAHDQPPEETGEA
jgi:biopolymer transport protein ExbB